MRITGSYLVFLRVIVAWSSPSKSDEVSSQLSCPDPWSQGDKPSNKDGEIGWADFSSASFSNFNATFSEIDKNVQSDKKEGEIKGIKGEEAKNSLRKKTNDSIETVAQDVQLAVDKKGEKNVEETAEPLS